LRFFFDLEFLLGQFSARLEKGVEENVGVYKLQCGDRSDKALFKECGFVKSTLSDISMESNRLEGDKGSIGDSSIFSPRFIRITLSDLQPRLQAAGMATLPWASSFFRVVSTNLVSLTKILINDKYKLLTKNEKCATSQAYVEYRAWLSRAFAIYERNEHTGQR